MSPTRYPVAQRASTNGNCQIVHHSAKMLEKRLRVELVQPSHVIAMKLSSEFSGDDEDEARFQLAVFKAAEQDGFETRTAFSVGAADVVRTAAERLYGIVSQSSVDAELPGPELRDSLLALRRMTEAVRANVTRGSHPIVDPAMEAALLDVLEAFTRGQALLKDDVDRIEEGELELRTVHPAAESNVTVALALVRLLNKVKIKDTKLDVLRDALRQYPQDVFGVAMEILKVYPDTPFAHAVQVEIVEFGRYRLAVDWNLDQF